MVAIRRSGKKVRKQLKQQRRHGVFESLEARRVLAVAPLLGADGLVEIHGTEAAETIVGEVVGTRLCFTIDDGPSVCFSSRAVKAIHIFGNGGGDHLGN